MQYNISFDLCAAVITLLALREMIAGRDLTRRANRIFLAVILLHLISCIFDVWSSVCNSWPESWSAVTRDLTNYIFLGAHTSEAFIFLWFLCVRLDVWDRLGRWQKWALALPELTMVLLPLAGNPAVHGVFAYDGGGNYVHGRAMFLLYAGADLYMLLCILLMARKRESLTVRQRRTAVFLLLCSLVPMLVQSIFLPRQLIEMFFQALGLYGFMREGAVFESARDLLRAAPEEDTDYVMPADLQARLERFLAGLRSLTPAERNIAELYIEGHGISEIPGLAFISMNTVKKHNKNIYRKLGVGSREELLLYADLLRQYGRLEDWGRPEGGGK